MHVISLILIALAMSTDAFAVALGRGVALKTPGWPIAFKTGLIFGLTETLAPLCGWTLGYVAVQFISQWDHWIVLALLSALGIRMIKNGLAAPRTEERKAPARSSWGMHLLLAVSTSLDSFALGISLAFAEVNIALAALMIGCATFTMVSLGIMAGCKIGEMAGRKAEILGGAILIIIGLITIYKHME